MRRVYRINMILFCSAGLSAAAGAGEPETTWSVQPDHLRVASDAPLALSLTRPDAGVAGDWKNARLADCFIQAGGVKQKLEPSIDAADPSRLSFATDIGGPGVLCVAVGSPADADRPDAWRCADYCAKLLVHPANGRNTGGNPLATVKVGHPIEVRALADPSRLAAGDDLPVRLYVDGSKVAGGSVHALRTGDDGATSRVEPLRGADGKGIAWFRLAQAGRWTVRFEHTVTDPDGTRRKLTGDLIFEIGEEVAR